MSEAPDVSVVIPALDAGQMLVDCVAALETGPASREVIVFDNGSSDDAASQIAGRDQRVRVLRSETNVGYAVASNRGAREASGRYVLFLNSDAVIGGETVTHLVAIADADPDGAAWQPLVRSTDGSVEDAGSWFSFSGFFLRRTDPPADPAPYPVFGATGACLLVRRDAFEHVGGFEEGYFAYIEDMDLCWRLRLAGWEVRVVPSISVTHVGNVTTKRIFGPDQVRSMTFRNRFRTILADASLPVLVRLVPSYVLASLATATLLALSGRLSSASAIVRALVWPLIHRREIGEQRHRARALRRVDDRDVLRSDLVLRLGPRRAYRLFVRHRERWT